MSGGAHRRPPQDDRAARSAARATRRAEGAPPGHKGFVRQSAGSSVAALVAMLSGLLLDVALAVRFGAGQQSDSFFVAARIPIGLCALLMTVATQAFVPLFTRDRREGGQASLTRLASRMLTAVLVLGIVLWSAATVLAQPLVSLTAPGLDAQQVQLAAAMVPPMFLVVPLVAAAETIRAAMNASYSFVLPAAMNLFMNGLTASLILLNHGHDIRTVAWAYVAGAGFQLVVITVLAWVHGLRVHLSLRVDDPRVRQAFALTGRPTLSSLLNLGNRVVEQLLVSFLPSGSITVLAYGQRLISALGGGIFFRPVTVTLLPRLADAEHADDRPAVADLVARGLRFVLAISLPLTAFTVVLAEPVIRLVFHRGSFGPVATHLLGLTLAIYGASLVGSGVQRVLLAPFFARLDTRTPLRNTAYGVAVDLVLLLPCIALFGRHSVEGVLGVAVAYSVTQYVIVGHAWVRLRRTVPLRARTLLGFTVRSTLGALAGAGVMVWLLWAFEVRTITDRSQLLGTTAVVGLAGAAAMALVAAVLFGPRRARLALSGVRRRRRGSPGRVQVPEAPLALSSAGEITHLGSSSPFARFPTTPGDDSSTAGKPDGRSQRESRALVHHSATLTADAGHQPAGPARSRVATAVLLVGFPLALLVAVATGLLAVKGVDRTELVLPLAALVGLGLVGLGLWRFEWFVLCVLAVRTVVDVTKVGPSANQLAGAVPSASGDGISSGPAASALAILFIALSAAWLLMQHRAGRGMRLTVADAAFALFVGSCLLSVTGSVNRSATLTETARIVAAVLMFVVLERLLTSMTRVRRVLVACFVALAAPVALGLVQAVTGHGRFETAGVSRVVGTFLHPNTFGFFLSMFMLMAIAVHRHCRPRTRLALWVVTAVCGGLLVLTYSRGSWIAFTLGLVLIGVLQSRAVFAWMLGGALVALAALPSVVLRLSDLGAGNTVTGSAGNSLTWRFDYWASVLQLNHANPVTGIGLKGTRFLTDQSKAPHNDFLRAYAETGALGLLAFVVVLVALVSIARQALRQADPGLARGIAVGFAAVLVAYVVDSIGDNLMSEVVVLWYFYAFAACAFAVSRLGHILVLPASHGWERPQRPSVEAPW